MELQFDFDAVRNYQSQSQIARILTEQWVEKNSYCPNCGNENLSSFENNKPVADFFCVSCQHEFELKSKSGLLGKKIVDGAYNTMISRITSQNNPNFFFLTYNKNDWSVNNFLIIPNHYFIPELIEKRKPLSETAKRAGWIGCNILLDNIPSTGRVFIVKDSKIVSKESVIEKWQKTEFLSTLNLETKGWFVNILGCIDKIPKEVFNLEDLYKFENQFKLLYPRNNFIKDKIRQQLQVARDKGLIEFVGRGVYKKIKL